MAFIGLVPLSLEVESHAWLYYMLHLLYVRQQFEMLWELDPVIPVGPLQLKIFCDSIP